MKKYERLPLEQRKEEICRSALTLFNEKGFSATTMENIIDQVSLSKGGVYRIYPSTTAILSDIILEGMHKRNLFYEQQVLAAEKAGQSLTLPLLIEMIADSLLLYPEISSVYVEFLWEKRRRPELEKLYRDICEITVKETRSLMEKYGAEDLLNINEVSIGKVTELMNGAILSMHVLGLQDEYLEKKKEMCEAFAHILEIE